MIHYAQYFLAFTGIDTRNLTELALIAGATAGDYSDESGSGFTITRNGVSIVVTGTDLTFTGGLPDGGTILGIAVKHGGATAYTVDFDFDAGDGLTVGEFNALFDTSDTAVIARRFFAGNDMLIGSAQNDVIYGFGGADSLSGGSGEDRIYGGAKGDELYGGNDDDRLFGQDGNDTLNGGEGNDVLDGGRGSDTASYQGRLVPVTATLDDGRAVEAKIGISEVDILKNIENLTGGLGADRLTGDSRDNQLLGYAGKDVLSGLAGRDVLNGGYENDTLTGGSGRDDFVFDTLPALGGGIVNIDTIRDFSPGIDEIHLNRSVYFGPDKGRLSAENFLAAPGAFAGETGEQFIVYNTKTGALFYDASGDGSGMVFQFARLKGAPHIDAGDFLIT